MSLKTAFLYLCTLLIFLSPAFAYAVESPLIKPNNKVGIHILFPEEIEQAAALINSNGGQWGYVTIPIQASDKNLEKWQKFMDDSYALHVIPLIRLATEGDYFNTKVWRKPTEADIVDFANFLDSLSWPTKNRYVIIFNEVNRADEWGGQVNPSEYAQLLSYTVTVFKSVNQDFFIISSGMDNASANVSASSYNQFTYFQEMNEAVPGIFNQIDGIGSHSYPNPGFSQPPSIQHETSIASFRFERDFIKLLSGKDLPVFITETGWSKGAIPSDRAGTYLIEAFESVWSDPGVVTVTPFLLRANMGPFVVFSLLSPDGSPSVEYKAIEEMGKVKGSPTGSNRVLGLSSSRQEKKPDLEVKEFEIQEEQDKIALPSSVKAVAKWLMKL